METNENFRDRIATVDKGGKRSWIYPKKPEGKFYTLRSFWSVIQLLIFVSLPLIYVNGHPFLLLNFLDRKFIIFGLPFGPHDFYILVLVFISSIVFILLFTAIYGRIFCGWLCPQTFFMEMIYRKIEYFIDGDYGSQQRLAKAELNDTKLFKRSIKYSLFFIISLTIVVISTAYFSGISRSLEIITNPSENTLQFTVMLVLTFLLFFEYSRFREQLCTLVCPYGRLQSVLLDQNSLVITYDYKRGEPRKPFAGFGTPRNAGSCIDCGSCVYVCPTGIDIRNGTQLECVNCTACIDACDRVMKIVKMPTGLIRYATKSEIDTGIKKIFSARVIAYSIVLLFFISLVTYLISNRSEFDVTLLRTPGVMYQDLGDGRISNLYDLKIINKTFNPIQVELNSELGQIKLINDNLDVESQEVKAIKFLIIIDLKDIKDLLTPIKIDILSNKKVIKSIGTSFLGKSEDEEQNEN